MKVLLMLRIEISFLSFTFFLYFDTSLSDLLSEAMHFYRNYIRIKKYALLIYYYLSTEFKPSKMHASIRILWCRLSARVCFTKRKYKLQNYLNLQLNWRVENSPIILRFEQCTRVNILVGTFCFALYIV